ncbi:Bug family tripartite tricarboxylate transporter substrate binding protein [Variovorax paradoxus]|jgi:tripartite-type tricarboxylate transporter receptor subunit TctC|uniref:Bug family tripartite tricarboxylate transporter substrate binding protein n=1 Tax=Variovorax paradoxus TaxID=34073 RepID=UPI0029C67C9B|nr:tripartite tricarboxylate transporter substrate-binding protein [Variovorax paradoxus]WPH24239.1 tripartite tricarboxylate transporter substrate-binding protein [Variovorax paradoxus]
MTRPSRRTLAALGVALIATTFAFPATAQSYPDRPMRVSVGFPAGTGPDLLARVVGQRLSEFLNQPVVVDNKPGAGGQIATQLVAKSAADGYNLLMAEAGSVSIAPTAFEKLPYNPARELVGVAELAWADFVLVVPVISPYKTLAEMVGANKGKSRALNFATFGAGSPGHFGAVEFGTQADVKVEPIHFRSTGDAVTAIIAGDVDGAWVSTAVASAQLKGGKMRALATTAQTRSQLVPTVPTTAEAGMPSLRFSSWLAILAPAGTPEAALDTLSRGLVRTVQLPEVRQKLIEAGFTVTGAGRTETDRMLKAEALRWGSIVKTSGFKGD